MPPVHFGVWAENEAPLAVLMAMRTQLRRSGLDGRVEGLDYAVLPWVMRRCGIAEADFDAVFLGVQCAEAELVKILNRD